MWLSKGIIISIDKVNLVEKFHIDYQNIQNSQGSHQKLIQSLEACIRHDSQFPNVIKNDNGKELLKILLKLDAEILPYTDYYMDDIIKSINESSRIGRDVKIKFFENLRNKLIQTTMDVRKNIRDAKMHEHFAGIIKAYGINTKYIPSDKQKFFRSDFLAIESLKLLIHFMFGNDKQISSFAASCSQEILTENGMTFAQAIYMYRKDLLKFIVFRTFNEAIESSESFYHILKSVSYYIFLKNFN